MSTGSFAFYRKVYPCALVGIQSISIRMFSGSSVGLLPARAGVDSAPTPATPLASSSILTNAPAAAEGSLRRAVLAAWAVIVAGLDDIIATIPVISEIRDDYLTLANADLMQYAQSCVISESTSTLLTKHNPHNAATEPGLAEAPEVSMYSASNIYTKTACRSWRTSFRPCSRFFTSMHRLSGRLLAALKR